MCSPERTLNCKWARTLRDARTRNGCTADNATMIATAQAFSALDFQIPHFCLRSQLSYSPTIYIFSRAVSAWVCVWMTLWLRRVGELSTFNIQRRKYVSFERRKKHFSLSSLNLLLLLREYVSSAQIPEYCRLTAWLHNSNMLHPKLRSPRIWFTTFGININTGERQRQTGRHSEHTLNLNIWR